MLTRVPVRYRRRMQRIEQRMDHRPRPEKDVTAGEQDERKRQWPGDDTAAASGPRASRNGIWPNSAMDGRNATTCYTPYAASPTR